MERSNFSYNIEDYNPDSEPEDWASKLVWKAETARQERLREEETRAKEAEKGLVEEEDGQFKLAEFDAESAGEAGKKVAEIVSGGSLKGEEIAGFEMKTKAPETGVKDTGHPERFEARERKNIESKTLVALISREPRALDAPGFWTSKSDLERNKDAIEEMHGWLAGAEESEFETEAKKLVEHLPTGVAVNGVEQSYDAIKDNNEALVMMYRETWDELKDEPAWKKTAEEVTDEEKKALGQAGITAFLKKYPTAVDFRQAQRDFFSHAKESENNRQTIVENREKYFDAMLGLATVLYGDQELYTRAMEKMRREAKTGQSKPEIKAEAEPAEEVAAEESKVEAKPEAKPEAAREFMITGDELAKMVAETEAKKAKEAAEKAAAEAKAVAGKTEPAPEEKKETLVEASKEMPTPEEIEAAVAEAERAEKLKAAPVETKAERKDKKDSQYSRFVRIANQRLLGFNRWRGKDEAKPAETKKTEKTAEKKSAKKAEKVADTSGKLEEIDVETQKKFFDKFFDATKKFGNSYRIKGENKEGLTYAEVFRAGLYPTVRTIANVLGQKQAVLVSDPYEVEGRKAMTLYGREKSEDGKNERGVIRTLIQKADGKFYMMDKYKMLKSEIVDGVIDEGGVDWKATEEMMKEIKDKGLEKALNELAKRKAVKVEDAVRLALVGAAKEISLSRA